MTVSIVNGTVGLPFPPPPFHLCGNLISIQNIDLGHRDHHPTLEMILPALLFNDVFTIKNRQAIINLLDSKAIWQGLTGGIFAGQKKCQFILDLESHSDVNKLVERAMKPLTNIVQAKYLSLVCVKYGAL
jgi:hypothetical protein